MTRPTCRRVVGDASAAAACVLAACLVLGAAPAAAQGQTPPAAQPGSPPAQGASSKAQSSPVVDSIAAGQKPAADPRPEKIAKPRRRRVAHRRRDRVPADVERPALAGVLLVEPVPPPVAAPRPIIPTPAYFVDGLVSAFTIAPPPLVCRPARRDPDLPDPRLYREVPLACAPDIE